MSFLDIFKGILLNGKLETEDLNPKEYEFIGLYFGASWCRPCSFFSKNLTKIYQKINNKCQQKFEDS